MDLTSTANSVIDVITKAPRIDFPPVRFGTETSFIGISVLINIIGILVVNRAQNAKASVYHIFYFNLALSNICACPLTWLANNIMFLWNDWFSDMLADPVQKCTATVYSTVGVFVALAIGIQMTLGMVGLGMVQYMAICHPLKSLYVLQKKRTYTFIVCAGLFSLVCAALPLIALTIMTKTQPCTDDVLDKIFASVIIVADIYISIIGSLYIVMGVFAVRVYQAIKRYTDRQGKYNADKDKLKQDKRAFQTTIFLLLTLTIFFIPITLYFLVNLNVDGISGVQANMVLFYLTMMPCTKCIADPIIYGSRMRDVAKEWRRMICCTEAENTGSMYNSTSGLTENSSIAAIEKVIVDKLPMEYKTQEKI